MKHQEITDARVGCRSSRSILDVNTQLEHFAIISYKVPVEKVEGLIPKPFKLWTFKESGKEYALVSAVPFKDKDFSFHRISKLFKFNFFQTNFRTYIIDERDNSHSAWFFGTTLGSVAAIIPKKIWRMPWEYGSYKFSFKRSNDLYSSYNMEFKSKLGNGLIEIKSTGNDMGLLNGFKNLDEQVHVLTHPVIGYYGLSKNQLGTYEIWHPKIDLKEGEGNKLYFELFEKLGFLTRAEMNKPHSVLITSEVEFDILLPPRKIRVKL
ncbi:MAG: DUF2071 domain-containing protein [Crocinitomicaceae bacterium]|nr:DUF2071 domain-containing protein [Crocinitomicaceae bacterium]